MAQCTNGPNENSQDNHGLDKRILVVGAGMSGLLIAIKLLQSGRSNLVIFEKADEVGGTWRDNVYPGLKCDVPAAMFSYSFAPNTKYTARFPAGSEIQSYLLSMAEQFDLRSHIQFNTSVTAIHFTDGRWSVQTADGETQFFDIVINATGVLHHPNIPEIEGREKFGGTSFHTARWNKAVDFTGKRVGLIGSGATAAQIVPTLVEKSKQFTLFQRTPQWIFPMPNKRYSAAEQNQIQTKPGRIQKLRYRYSKLFQWTFSRAVIGNRFLLWGIEAFCRLHLKRKVKDPSLRQQLTPDYRCGCKRLIFAKGFYQAIQAENATLCCNTIVRIVRDGIVTEDGKLHPLDVLIYATGFEVHDRNRPLNLIGREGVTLEQAWSQGATAYRSTSIPGFPNYFMIFGPYSPIGNYSAFSVAEVQVDHILRSLDHLDSSGADLIEPSHRSTHRQRLKMQIAMKKTVWMSGCNSWYQDKHGDVQMWPWTFERYEREMSILNKSDFELTRRASCTQQATPLLEANVPSR
jgi:cation diffusion facilitator CzcD-associated flavoprotein CzcO